MLDGLFRRREAEEPAAIQPHKNFGTLRVGTLRNHSSGRETIVHMIGRSKAAKSRPKS